MENYRTAFWLMLFMAFAFCIPCTGYAQTCETHTFGTTTAYDYVYTSGKAWDFTAQSNMLIEAVEAESYLAAVSSGTFHIRIEINNQVISVMDQYVDTNLFQPYVTSDTVTTNLQAGDKITYRIYGYFSTIYPGGIRGVNQLTLCGTPGVRLSPPGLQDHFLDLTDSFDTPQNFPYGLAFDGTHLWVMGQVDTTVYKIDTSGSVVDSFAFPGYISPGDLAFDGTHLWAASTHQEKIHQVSTSGVLIQTINAPGDTTSGLACDGRYLWITSNEASGYTVYKIDRSGNVITSFASPGGGFKGLTFDGRYLWHVDATKHMLYKFDREGTVHGIYELPLEGEQIGPRGLATDGTSLWYSNYYDNKIYRIALPQAVTVGEQERRTINFKITDSQSVTLSSLSIANDTNHAFQLENDTCSGQTLHGPDACSFDILFSSASPGTFTADLLLPLFLPGLHTITAQLECTAEESVLLGHPGGLPWVQLLLLCQ